MDCKGFTSPQELCTRYVLCSQAFFQEEDLYLPSEAQKDSEPKEDKEQLSTITSTPGMNARFSHHVLLN